MTAADAASRLRSFTHASASARRVEKASQGRPVVAGDLETGHASHHGLFRGVAQGFETALEFAAVVGADQELGAFDLDEVGAAPFTLGVPRHVGDDRVGVELRVEIAAGVVAEGGRHQAVDP